MITKEYKLRIDEDSWKERCTKKPTQAEIFKDFGIPLFFCEDIIK